MGTLLNLSLLFLGAIAGNLLFAGYLIYGVPLTLAGLILALFVLRADRRERGFDEQLRDKPVY